MQTGHPISALMLGTLIVTALIIGIVLLRFLAKRGNRHPMRGQRERNIDEIRNEKPEG